MLSGTISLFCSKCFSPFPHGTGSLSVSREYLALPDGPGRFTQNSSCSALLRIPIRLMWFRIRGCHPLRRIFPYPSARHISPTTRSYNPRRAVTRRVWALPRSLATTWGIILLFSLPPATKMFQFTGLASHALSVDPVSSTRGVVPFGYPRVKGHLHLAAAFRSLSRPSSPPRAKASAMRPYLTFLVPGSTTRPHSCGPAYTTVTRSRNLFTRYNFISLVVSSCQISLSASRPSGL